MKYNNKKIPLPLIIAFIVIALIMVGLYILLTRGDNTEENYDRPSHSYNDYTDAPDTDYPESDAPDTENPSDTSEDSLSPTTEPKTDAPETLAPKTEASQTEAPEVTEAPQATETPKPTKAPKPTEAPKATDTPVPTDTPAPTNTPTPTATPVPTNTPEASSVSYHFRNNKLLTQHYEKHGIEMGFDSKESYEKAASDVINNPKALHKLEASEGDGDMVYYVEATNEFAILSADGYLRTYFLPSAGKKYYDRQ